MNRTLAYDRGTLSPRARRGDGERD
ncbi:hypothetical protein FRACA_1360016 [Frankia canadensis]|uniref:Uncharacterized protein n=1 Tax=Frankia canadensis TaxID=1836972 RepID=A0A2I2KKZ3_9ACTN|nr:hypothetical protein FRACA_1360016 [Frankia canadensis]SOU53628.1 hypothetical protein FRACA_1360016 [Frankia canadensis]